MHDIKYRSWGAFGGSVAAVGFCLIGLAFIYPACTKHIGIASVIFLAVGIPLVIAGLKVAAWDKAEEAQMTSVDPDTAYRFTLVSDGVEKQTEDYAEIERAFHDFRDRKKEWRLKIEPPIGSLAEWKSYYDPKLQFVTEITLIKSEGVQRWCRFCDGPADNDLKILKTIIVKRKKTRLFFTGKPEDMQRYKDSL